MAAIDPVATELEDLKTKRDSARAAARRPDATERDKSDLKLLEQAYIAARQRAKREGAGGGAGTASSDAARKVDRKLDAALKDTFPGSDPVSFVEAAPVKKEDRSLPEVKANEEQKAGKGT